MLPADRRGEGGGSAFLCSHSGEYVLPPLGGKGGYVESRLGLRVSPRLGKHGSPLHDGWSCPSEEHSVSATASPSSIKKGECSFTTSSICNIAHILFYYKKAERYCTYSFVIQKDTCHCRYATDTTLFRRRATLPQMQYHRPWRT